MEISNKYEKEFDKHFQTEMEIWIGVIPKSSSML